MTHISAAHTASGDAAAAAEDLSRQILSGHDDPPDAVVVFASSNFEYVELLRELERRCGARVLMGSSSAGEFTDDASGTGSASALAIRSKDLVLRASLGTGVGRDAVAAARELVRGFAGPSDSRHAYRAALVMTDALAGHADALVEALTLETAGRYVLAGGGAGDDARFTRTHVFHGTEVHTDAVVALEILSNKPIGVGIGHGWEPASPPLRVTEVDGLRLVGLDGLPAVEAYERHAAGSGTRFDRTDPLGYFLHNILGIETPAGHRLRVPLSVDADGSIRCAAEVPRHSIVQIMRSSNESAARAATRAASAAVAALGDAAVGGALFFDCVATRLRMGDEFALELDSVAAVLGDRPFVGCNTYGQIARTDRQFSGFHNCTAVVLALPR